MCLLGGKSPIVKLMSRRENKELAKTNLQKHGQNYAKITVYRIHKRSTAQKFITFPTVLLFNYIYMFVVISCNIIFYFFNKSLKEE